MSENRNELSYQVPGMSCAHCRTAIASEVESVPGVAAVDVDLEAGRVVVSGTGLDDVAIRTAIDRAGYDIVAEPR